MTDISKSTYKNFNPGELNSLNKQIFESRYDHNLDTFAQFAQIFRKHYEFDIWQGTGPYLAVVLKVLSGPHAKNEASTGGTLSKTLILDEVLPAPLASTTAAGKDSPTRVIAKIPEFDVDIAWPESNDDEARIAAHGEYHADPKTKQNLGDLSPGALIWVTYSSNKPRQGADGRPAGYIIGVHSPAVFVKEEALTLPKKVFNPKCPSPVVKEADSGLYAGKTASDIIGLPPIRKIKGKIKTGVYGNGTPQTRAHFEEALLKAETSYKHKIKGAAPGPNNAFIWIGHLKNNGHLDLLDRPISPGRETIIYSSKMLDLSSDIEIKYYFHDEGGFGSPWVNGPSATIANAVKSASMQGNDFKEKIAPAIKDMVREGRNCILVIPEMMHSRGFGTKPTNIDRYENNILIGATGAGVTGINVSSDTVRSRVDSASGDKLRPLLKQYLKNIKVDKDTSVLKVTRMRERMFSTFDGSYTGGNFKLFHQEVLDVLSEHLGNIRSKISRISIVADGAGALTLASMVKNNPTSSVQSKARTAFKTLKINQIDYISRPGKNDDGYYQFAKLPAYTIYQDYLLEKSELLSVDLVFNYISSNDERISAKKFFSSIGHELKFDASWNNSKQLFAVQTAQAALSKNFIILHKIDEKDKVGYAMNALPDSALSIPTVVPLASDSVADKGEVPPPVGIPDHAAALASKKGLARLSSLIKEQTELKKKVDEWEYLFQEIATAGGNIHSLCSLDQYRIYCVNGYFKYGLSDLFGIKHKQYFNDKKRYVEISDPTYGEIAAEMFKIKFDNNRIALNTRIKELKEVKLDPNLAEGSTEEAQALELTTASNYWNFEIAVAFDLNRFITIDEMSKWVKPGDPLAGIYADAAAAYAKPELIKKYINLLEKQILKASAPGGLIPEDCAPQPKPLKDVSKPQTVNSKAPAPESFKCEDGKTLPNPGPRGYKGLYKLIPFYTTKKAWLASKNPVTKTHGGAFPTGIENVSGFEISGFKFIRRAGTGTKIQKRSKSQGLWKCVAPLVEEGIKKASEESKYYIHGITSTMRGCTSCSPGGAGGKNGISLHSFGLAFDVDPFFNGYATDPKYRTEESMRAHTGKAYNSNFQGAFMPGIGDNVHLEKMNVYSGGIEYRKRNIYEDDGKTRKLSENWKTMPDAYGAINATRAKYYDNKIMRNKGTAIVPEGANPLLWAIIFCETTGFGWGNGTFLKRKANGAKFSKKEIREINKIFKDFGIEDVVERVRDISWGSRLDDAMHFHYYRGMSLVSWRSIKPPKK